MGSLPGQKRETERFDNVLLDREGREIKEDTKTMGKVRQGRP